MFTVETFISGLIWFLSGAAFLWVPLWSPQSWQSDQWGEGRWGGNPHDWQRQWDKEVNRDGGEERRERDLHGLQSYQWGKEAGGASAKKLRRGGTRVIAQLTIGQRGTWLQR